MPKDTGTNYLSSRFRRHAAPVIVWLMAVGVIAFMFNHRNERYMVRGIARGEICQVTSTDTARIKSVKVKLFQKVRKGDILAVLDDSQIQAEIKTAETQLGCYRAERDEIKNRMAVEAANLRMEWQANQRQFTNDLEETRLKKMALEAAIKTGKVRLNALKVEIEITQQLLAENAVARYELDKVQYSYDALASEIEENEKALEQTVSDLGHVQERASHSAATPPVDPSVENALERVEKSVEVQNKLIDELRVAQAAMTLRSPLAGVVIQVNCTEGGTIRPVAPGFIISGNQVEEVVAYLGEGQMNALHENVKVELIKTSQPSGIALSKVVSVSPVMELMPERLWQNPNVPQWGRAFIMNVPLNMELRNGEQIGIRL